MRESERSHQRITLVCKFICVKPKRHELITYATGHYSLALGYEAYTYAALVYLISDKILLKANTLIVGLLCPFNDFVDEAVLHRFLAAHPEITLHVLFNLTDLLAGILGKKLV
jgi:hypothetical protein